MVKPTHVDSTEWRLSKDVPEWRASLLGLAPAQARANVKDDSPPHPEARSSAGCAYLAKPKKRRKARGDKTWTDRIKNGVDDPESDISTDAPSSTYTDETSANANTCTLEEPTGFDQGCPALAWSDTDDDDVDEAIDNMATDQEDWDVIASLFTKSAAKPNSEPEWRST